MTVIDPRTAYATDERFPDVKVIAEWPDEALPPLGVDHYTAFVALTHDPKIDDPALLHALARDCFYIGALGSKKTHARRIERLKGQGMSEDVLARIHAPIGLVRIAKANREPVPSGISQCDHCRADRIITATMGHPEDVERRISVKRLRPELHVLDAVEVA